MTKFNNLNFRESKERNKNTWNDMTWQNQNMFSTQHKSPLAIQRWSVANQTQ